MSTIEDSFDEYMTHLSELLQNKIDPALAMRIMYLERKLPDVEPKVELDIKLRDGANAADMISAINAKFGFQVSGGKNHITAVGRTDMNRLARFASHPDFKWISGLATPASY